jgi:hypothetical protein
VTNNVNLSQVDPKADKIIKQVNVNLSLVDHKADELLSNVMLICHK